MVSTASDDLGRRRRPGPTMSPMRGVLVGAAAERDLVEFLAVLVDAENADMADMVMAAGIDAAGDLDLQLADIEQAGQVGEVLADLLRDRDRAGIGERAIVEAGAGDDVADQAEVRRRELERRQLAARARRDRPAGTCGSTRFCSWVTRISPKL